jgi:hypothetical protein
MNHWEAFAMFLLTWGGQVYIYNLFNPKNYNTVESVGLEIAGLMNAVAVGILFYIK